MCLRLKIESDKGHLSPSEAGICGLRLTTKMAAGGLHGGKSAKRVEGKNINYFDLLGRGDEDETREYRQEAAQWLSPRLTPGMFRKLNTAWPVGAWNHDSPRKHDWLYRMSRDSRDD